MMAMAVPECTSIMESHRTAAADRQTDRLTNISYLDGEASQLRLKYRLMFEFRIAAAAVTLVVVIVILHLDVDSLVIICRRWRRS